MLLVFALSVACGCSAPITSPRRKEAPARARPASAARVETGRLSEEDLGIPESLPATDPDRVPVPPDLARSRPEQAAALRMTERARKLLATGVDTQRAISLLEQAVGLDSHTPYAYFFLGEAYFRLGSPKQALAFLERASSLIGGDPRWGSKVWGLRGIVWESQGERAKALHAYELAVKLWPENLTAVSGRARLAGSMRE